MKLQFLGTGAAEGVPGIFCDCETCKEIRWRGEGEFHSRSQFLLDDTVGIDFPPDAYYHALRKNTDLSALEYLLVTHSHMDHFYAHDFVLRGYKHAPTVKKPLHIFGNEVVGKVFAECTHREMRAVVAENVKVTQVYAFTPFSFGENGEYTAVPLRAQHGQAEEAFVYLIQKGETYYLHLTDTGRLPKETLDYLEIYFADKNKKVDFVTFDCTFLFREAGEVSRHMGLMDNRTMQEEFLRRKIADGHTKYAITHYSHNDAPLTENLARAEKEYGYFASYDGAIVEF